MGATEYLRTKEQAEKLSNTMLHKLTSAYLQGVNELQGTDNLLDFKELEKPEAVSKVTDAAYKIMVEYALKTNSSTATDEITQARLVSATFGINKRDIKGYFKGGKGRSFNDFIQYIGQNAPAFRYTQDLLTKQTPLDQLQETDAEKEDVLKYLGITDNDLRKKLKAKIKDNGTLAQLLDIHQENGEIPKRTLDEILKAA